MLLFNAFIYTNQKSNLIENYQSKLYNFFVYFFTERTDFVVENTKIYPRLCAYLFINRVSLHVNHPELIKQVLMSPHCLKKTSEYRFAGWGLGLGTAPRKFSNNSKRQLMELIFQKKFHTFNFFLHSAHIWRVTRKHVNPVLGTKALLTFIPIFDECSQDFVNHLRPHVDKGEFDLFKYAVLVTLDSICGMISIYFV